MTVVLFCGGRGLRLRADAPGVPKPLIRIGGQPILTHLMRWYAHHGHREFVLCLGSRGAMIERHFLESPERVGSDTLPSGITRVLLRTEAFGDWTVDLVPTGETTSIGQRLRAVRPHLNGEPFLANYADGLSDLDLPDFVARFADSGALAAMVSVRPPGSFHAVSIGPEGAVDAVMPLADSGVRINGGFFGFRSEVFDWLTPKDDLATGLLPRLASARALFGYAHDGFWACMDTARDRHRLEALEANGHTPWKPWLAAPGTDPARRRPRAG
jgi:glucose-1-phosphate cytidylyltransferase